MVIGKRVLWMNGKRGIVGEREGEGVKDKRIVFFSPIVLLSQLIMMVGGKRSSNVYIIFHTFYKTRRILWYQFDHDNIFL